MNDLIKIPYRFYIDHAERALPTPEGVKYAGRSNAGWRYVWIRRDDPALPELISDAEYYSDKYGPSTVDRGPCPIKNAAKALLKVLQTK